MNQVEPSSSRMSQRIENDVASDKNEKCLQKWRTKNCGNGRKTADRVLGIQRNSVGCDKLSCAQTKWKFESKSWMMMTMLPTEDKCAQCHDKQTAICNHSDAILPDQPTQSDLSQQSNLH